MSLYIYQKTQEGCGGLRGENPGAFPKAGPIFQQPFALPENAQTLAGITFFGAAGKSVKNSPAASKFARKLFQQGISDSHSLLEFSEFSVPLPSRYHCMVRGSLAKQRRSFSVCVSFDLSVLVSCSYKLPWRNFPQTRPPIPGTFWEIPFSGAKSLCCYVLFCPLSGVKKFAHLNMFVLPTCL